MLPSSRGIPAFPLVGEGGRGDVPAVIPGCAAGHRQIRGDDDARDATKDRCAEKRRRGLHGAPRVCDVPLDVSGPAAGFRV